MNHLLTRRRALTLGLAATLSGCAATPEYKPQRGQMGKDVMWLPTSERLTEKMLQMAGAGPQDLLYDLGAGDGVIPIYAAKTRGLRAVGIEYNPKLAQHARNNVVRAGLSDRVRIITGDIFVEDFSQATVVTMYLLPELNQQLRPTLLTMKPGTRLVSNSFDMGDWEPDASHEEGRESALMWVVPAPVAGRWTLNMPERRWTMTLDLSQRYQKIGGQLSIGGVTQPVLGASLRVDELQWVFIGPDEGSYSVRTRVSGSEMKGEVSSYGVTHPMGGRKL
ncbi:MAG: class I SAM-dependent methyltransferase [Alphaproteobacteria bacterium]|nr:class I SAM-dependent methyltransferase [Alphaproteobacteria bacterium]